jgi:hypothetical protein
MSLMQVQWCWRRKAEMAMLDEDEFSSVEELYRDAILGVKGLRQHSGVPLEHTAKLCAACMCLVDRRSE